MRPIKFRAIISERNATIYFDLTDLVHPARKDLFSKRELLIPWLLAGNKPDEYTGLKDKNGKEIFEGDIVKVEHFNMAETYTCQWDGERLGWEFLGKYDNRLGDEVDCCLGGASYPEIEVIGNIYETPLEDSDETN